MLKESHKKIWRERSDAYKIIVMATLGILFGVLIRQTAENNTPSAVLVGYLAITGEMWITALKMIVMPFMLTNMSTSVAEVKTMKDTGGLGKITFFWYMSTTCVACVMGVVMGSIFLLPLAESYENNQGNYTSKKTELNPALQPLVIVKSLVPTNFTSALANDKFVGVIVCAIFLGYLMNVPGEERDDDENREDEEAFKSHSLYLVMKELNDICFFVIKWLVAWTPIALLSLMIKIAATIDLAEAVGDVMLVYFATWIGMALHVLLVLPLLFFLFARENPYPRMKNVGKAIFVAMSTASSACTLPVTITCAIENNKVRPSIAKFVCSLGATVNMDGTAIYYPIAAMFIMISTGTIPDFGSICLIGIMAALTSMGASPIPGAGSVAFLLAICTAAGANDVENSPAFLLCVALDTLGDRPATACNIMGDSMGCVVVNKYAERSGVADAIDDSRLSQTAEQHARRFSGASKSWVKDDYGIWKKNHAGVAMTNKANEMTNKA
jgi:Na+/H+-dicarboxylate symporter